MIAYLSGQVHALEQAGMVVLVSGVGYVVSTPQRVLESAQVGSTVELFTHQHVREDALDLYGFTSREDLQVFQQLIQVSGVGPRVALGMLSALSASQIHQAVMNGDVAVLTAVPGIGKKTAERLVLDLKDRLDIGLVSGLATPQAQGTSGETVEALIALGYNRNEALQALAGVDTTLSTEDQIRQALQQSNS